MLHRSMIVALLELCKASPEIPFIVPRFPPYQRDGELTSLSDLNGTEASADLGYNRTLVQRGGRKHAKQARCAPLPELGSCLAGG